MDGPAPAIVNAVEDALQVRFDSIPLLPEDIFEKLTRQRGESDSQAACGAQLQ
jgi:hypothetical protein